MAHKKMNNFYFDLLKSDLKSKKKKFKLMIGLMNRLQVNRMNDLDLHFDRSISYF